MPAARDQSPCRGVVSFATVVHNMTHPNSVPPPGLSEPQRLRLLAWGEQQRREGFYAHSSRTWRDAGWVDRVFRRARQPFSLGAQASKIGGVPLLAHTDDWPRIDGRPLAAIGQINFEDLRPQLSPLPAKGVLVMFHDPGYWRGRQPLVCRWYPDSVAEPAAPPADAPPLHRLFETALRFERSALLPSPSVEELREILGTDGAPRTHIDIEFEEAIVDWVDAQGAAVDTHEVLPAELEALRESVGSGGLEGRVVLFRLSDDNEATLSFGTNNFYLHIAAEDLAEGRLDRVESASANA